MKPLYINYVTDVVGTDVVIGASDPDLPWIALDDPNRAARGETGCAPVEKIGRGGVGSLQHGVSK